MAEVSSADLREAANLIETFASVDDGEYIDTESAVALAGRLRDASVPSPTTQESFAQWPSFGLVAGDASVLLMFHRNDNELEDLIDITTPIAGRPGWRRDGEGREWYSAAWLND